MVNQLVYKVKFVGNDAVNEYKFYKTYEIAFFFKENID